MSVKAPSGTVVRRPCRRQAIDKLRVAGDERGELRLDAFDDGSPVPRGFGCRKIVIVGYQGLSRRPVSQRQHGSKRSSSQTGLPSAPARWATEVSTEMTRSRLATSAAVSAKSPISPMQSVSGNSAGRRRAILLQADEVRPGTRNNGASRPARSSAGDRAPRPARHVLARIARPHQPDADARLAQRGEPRPPGRHLRRIGVQVGHRAGNGVERRGPQRQRQAEHGAVQIEVRQCLAVRHHAVHARQAAEQSDQRPGAPPG